MRPVVIAAAQSFGWWARQGRVAGQPLQQRHQEALQQFRQIALAGQVGSQLAKDAGRPWEVGEAFEASAPCSALVPASAMGHPEAGVIWLDVNGQRKQTGDLNQMIWKVPEMISYLSGLFTLRAGDLILSGTPSGVGAVNRGDKLHGHIDGIGELEVVVL